MALPNDDATHGDGAMTPEELAQAFESAAVGLTITTLDGVVLHANPALQGMLGIELPQLRGRIGRDLTHPDDVPGTREELQRLIDGEIGEALFKKRYVTRSGDVVWARTRVGLLRDAAGAPWRLVAAIENVTPDHLATAALQEERQALALLHDSGQLLVSTLEREPLLQAITDTATRLTGAQFGAFFHNVTDPQTGETLQLYTLSGAKRADFEGFGHPRATALFGPTLRGEKPIRCDDVLADPRYGQSPPHHGLPPRHLPVRSYLSVPVKSRTGQVLGALMFGHPRVGVFTERSERLAIGVATQAAIALDNASMVEQLRAAAVDREHLLEAERAARSHAERESRLKDDFLATLSHELRTPLSAIMGWAQLLTTGRLSNEDARRAAESIARNARAQSTLVDDLLDMNRVTSGKVRLELVPVDPREIVQSAIDSVRPTIDGNGLTLAYSPPAQAARILGDCQRLRQVMWNLLSNSAKFTPRGGRIEIELLDLGEFASIVVRDSGIGIDPDFLPQIWDRFRQADAAAARRQGGLGIGLSLVKSLVEMHGGHVTARSEGRDRGTEITVTLPKARREADRAAPSTAPTPNDSFEAACVDLNGCHVMVIDDEPDARSLVEVLLGQCAARVTGHGSAGEALAALEHERPDVIVSDISMPGMDGYEFIQRVRQRDPDQGGAIPALALTALARAEDRTRALLAGFQAHVSKPADANELLSSVAGLIHLRRRAR